MLQESATVKIDWKLTTVPLITAINAVSKPITAVNSEDTLATGTLKCWTETALTCMHISVESIYSHHCFI